MKRRTRADAGLNPDRADTIVGGAARGARRDAARRRAEGRSCRAAGCVRASRSTPASATCRPRRGSGRSPSPRSRRGSPRGRKAPARRRSSIATRLHEALDPGAPTGVARDARTRRDAARHRPGDRLLRPVRARGDDRDRRRPRGVLARGSRARWSTILRPATNDARLGPYGRMVDTPTGRPVEGRRRRCTLADELNRRIPPGAPAPVSSNWLRERVRGGRARSGRMASPGRRGSLPQVFGRAADRHRLRDAVRARPRPGGTPTRTLPRVTAPIFISVDMEGVAGITTDRQTSEARTTTPGAGELMTEEANAAVAGPSTRGRAEVVVSDSHGDMGNLLPDLLDARAELVQGTPKVPWSMMTGIDEDFATARVRRLPRRRRHAGRDPGPHVHRRFMTDVRVNGASWNETHLNAALAGYLRRAGAASWPATRVLRSGDRGVAEVRTVTAKHGIGNRVGPRWSPRAAREAIRRRSRRRWPAPRRT